MQNVVAIVGLLLFNNWNISDPYPNLPAKDNLALIDNPSGSPPNSADNKLVKIVLKKLGFNPKTMTPQILIDELPNVKPKKIWISMGFLKIMHPILITIFVRPYAQRFNDSNLLSYEIVFRSIQSEIDHIINEHRFTTPINVPNNVTNASLNSTYLNEIQLTTWEEVTNRDSYGDIKGGEDNFILMSKQVVWCTYYDIA